MVEVGKHYFGPDGGRRVIISVDDRKIVYQHPVSLEWGKATHKEMAKFMRGSHLRTYRSTEEPEDVRVKIKEFDVAPLAEGQELPEGVERLEPGRYVEFRRPREHHPHVISKDQWDEWRSKAA